tara:strand:+ start:448 stop:786 length:339 start_codon:yes stop_codon:yes gene_type:complete
MKPNKSIPSFCFESPWLKPFDLSTEFGEINVTTRVIPRVRPIWVQELTVTTDTNNIITEEPIDSPQGNLFYFDYQFQNITDPIVYGDGSWSYENLFEGTIGIKLEIKEHKFI